MPMDDLIMGHSIGLDWNCCHVSNTGPLGHIFSATQSQVAKENVKSGRFFTRKRQESETWDNLTVSPLSACHWRKIPGGPRKKSDCVGRICFTQWPASKVCLDHSLRRLEQHGSWLVAPPKKISCLVSRREPHWGWSPSLPLEHEDKKWVRHAQELNKISPVGLFISSVMFWVHR